MPLKQVESFKYLGIVIDSKLTWKDQSIYLQAKLRKINYLLHYLAQFFTKSHMIKIYYALYQSVLQYGLMIWGGAADYHTNPIEILQKWAIRDVVGKKWGDSTKADFKNLKILQIKKLYQLMAVDYVQKHRKIFDVHINTRGRKKDNTVATVPDFRRERSSIQACEKLPRLFNAAIGQGIKSHWELHSWLLERDLLDCGG